MAEHRLAHFGMLLKSYRTSSGLTQEELAEAANVSVRSIGDLERGVQRTPYRDTVGALADALGLDGEQRATFVESARGRNRLPSNPSTSPHAPTGNFLGARPEGPLAGRRAELEQIGHTVERVRAGAGQLVLLAGEPGVGKTRLAQEIVLALQDRKFLIAAGSCYEFRQAVPFAPFLDVLDTLFTAAPSVIRTTLEERWPYLSHLLPEGFHADRLALPAGPEDQQRLFRAVSGFVLALAEITPVGLLVDDLQWADFTSLSLLHHLAWSTRGHSVFLLGTYRTVEVDRQHPLDRILLDLERAGVVEKVAVGRLHPEATAGMVSRMVGQLLPEGATQLIHARSEGNPFFVRQLVQSLLERNDDGGKEGWWTRQAIQDLAVPEGVRGLIGQRLVRLSAFTQTVLKGASVLGHTFAFDDLQRMGGYTESELGEALSEAATGGLVQEVDNDRYAFDHALTQQAVYEELATHRRRILHRAAGEALEREWNDSTHPVEIDRAAELAWHFGKGAEPARALPYAMLAGEHAQDVFAHEEAEQQYRSAAQWARDVGNGECEARALERLGAVLETRARYSEALQVLKLCVHLLRQLDDQEGECRVSAKIATMHAHEGTPEAGLAILQNSLTRFETEKPSRGLVAVYVALADLYMVKGQRALELAAAERAEELARVIGDGRLRAEATIVHGFALLHFGRSERGLQTLEEACRLAWTTGDHLIVCHAHASAGAGYRDQAHFARSMQYADAALEIAERLKEPMQIANMIAERGRIAMYMGDWHAARVDLERAVGLSRDLGAPRESVHTLTILGEFLLRVGEWDAASRHLEEALTLGIQAKYDLSVLWAQYHLAHLDLLQENATAARRRLLPLLDRLSEEDSAFPTVLVCLARVHLELGETAAALQSARQAVAAARAGGYRLALIAAILVHGMILARLGETAEAEHMLAECHGMVGATPYPYVEANILYERGLIHAQRREPDLARMQWEGALAIFRRLGAQWDIRRTEEQLASLV